MIGVAKELSGLVMGADKAGELFETFAVEGNQELDVLRTTIINPETQKKARTWGLSEASKMIGRSMNSLRTHDPHIPRDESGRWVFTLDDINDLRRKYDNL